MRPHDYKNKPGLIKCSVVFSYWVKMLDLVGKALQKENVIFQRIDGQKTLEERQAAMQEFNDNPDCTVLLASIGSSTEGYIISPITTSKTCFS